MSEKEIFDKVVKLLGPYVRNEAGLKDISDKTNIVTDLQVNSSRLVDIILAMEDEFDIEIADDEADKVETVGAAVNLIKGKIG
ncbi:MAG: phosphopantetheine-binding protein [Spirochaetia bacterium]|nr:phosphopantetheine-binding protein [Spirochaetia bacterium]